MTEAKTEEQWDRSNKDLYSQFRRVQATQYPPREAPLPFSEWFQIHHKNLFGPFIQSEIKFIRQYQMYSNYCYVNRLPESQLGQFRAAIRALSSSAVHTESLQVDFATLVIHDVVFLPPLHALIMDSSVGTLIFERAARVMPKLFVQDGRTNISCQGSVDTTINGVDTMVQSKGRNVKKRSTSVDTSLGQVDTESSQVDTRDLSQGFDLPVWESVSTHLMGRSTHSGISVT
ncbi:hypothetical protein Taro_024483 [Colocasia esculenta]|uniref:Uncharacterized protein n=1 Tax=Colocasia esculenta TaxID=4460 RepID=A0A843VBF8_COLES|nr:hypothetical protein [Colocasia esculenta]